MTRYEPTLICCIVMGNISLMLRFYLPLQNSDRVTLFSLFLSFSSHFDFSVPKDGKMTKNDNDYDDDDHVT